MFLEAGRTPAIALPASRLWVVSLCELTAISLLWGLLYRDAAVSAIVTWWESPTYSHCFLILPITLYLVWLRRHELARLVPARWAPGLLLAIPAGAGWVLGRLSSINEIQQFASV